MKLIWKIFVGILAVIGALTVCGIVYMRVNDHYKVSLNFDKTAVDSHSNSTSVAISAM